MADTPNYHAWTHRAKAEGGTDPVRLSLSSWREIKVFADDDALDGNLDPAAKVVSVGDEKFIFAITEEENAKKLLEAQAYVSTLSSSGDIVVSLRNLTAAGVNMLSTPITIDEGDYHSYVSVAPRVISTSNNVVHTGDRISIDIDDPGANAMGLGVILAFGIEIDDQGGAGPAGPTGATGPAGGAVSVTQAAHGFAVGNVIRRDSGGTYELAQADDIATSDVIGIVTAVDSPTVFRFTNAGEVTGLTGVTDGEVHYLSDTTPGGLTTTEPTISRPILIGTSGTTGIFISQGTGGSGGVNARLSGTDITADPRPNINFLDGFGTLADVTDDPGNAEVEVLFNLPDATGASDGDALILAVGTPAWVTPPGRQRTMEILVTDPNGAALTTGDGKAYVSVPALLGGMNLVAVQAHVTTVSSSGTPTIQINNVTQTADMLSTRITIDASEKDSSTAATPAVIDTANDDVATGDELRVDVDVAGTGTKGLIVMLTFETP